jgi:PAS domain-containing protein
VGVWDWNLITGELYLDSSLKAILGYTEDEILDRADSWAMFIQTICRG